jgi:hypothetical protein
VGRLTTEKPLKANENMILRRLASNLRQQNWIAVAIEFLVVVSGVVLGIQIDTWSTERARDLEFERAMLRFEIETTENIDLIRTIYTEVESLMPVISAGVDALVMCRGTPADIEAVENAVNETLATRGVIVNRTALNAIVNSDHHLARLSQASRSLITNYAAFIDEFQFQSQHLEDTPDEVRPWASASISVGALEQDVHFIYEGEDWFVPWRNHILVGEFSTACQDDQLLNGLRLHEIYQGALPNLFRVAESEMLKVLQQLAD